MRDARYDGLYYLGHVKNLDYDNDDDDGNCELVVDALFHW